MNRQITGGEMWMANKDIKKILNSTGKHGNAS